MTCIIIAVLSIIIGYLLFLNQRQRQYIKDFNQQLQHRDYLIDTYYNKAYSLQDDDNCYMGINVIDN